MPFDALPAAAAPAPRLPCPPPAPSLNQAEREAAAHFAAQLRPGTAPGTEAGPALLLLRLAPELGGCTLRLAPPDASPEAGEAALARIPEGWPRSAAKRQALAVRLASVAAVAWRQHRQIQRLGFLAA